MQGPSVQAGVSRRGGTGRSHCRYCIGHRRSLSHTHNSVRFDRTLTPRRAGSFVGTILILYYSCINIGARSRKQLPFFLAFFRSSVSLQGSTVCNDVRSLSVESVEIRQQGCWQWHQERLKILFILFVLCNLVEILKGIFSSWLLVDFEVSLMVKTCVLLRTVQIVV
jgi:hypothetical protein